MFNQVGANVGGSVMSTTLDGQIDGHREKLRRDGSVGRILCTTLTCKPEWCDRIKPSNLLLDQVGANVDRLVGFLESGGVPRAQGISTQSHKSPSILVHLVIYDSG